MSGRMGSFTVDSSLGFGIAVLRFLMLKAGVLTESSEMTPDKKCLLRHFTCHQRKLSTIILCHQW